MANHTHIYEKALKKIIIQRMSVRLLLFSVECYNPNERSEAKFQIKITASANFVCNNCFRFMKTSQKTHYFEQVSKSFFKCPMTYLNRNYFNLI